MRKYTFVLLSLFLCSFCSSQTVKDFLDVFRSAVPKGVVEIRVVFPPRKEPTKRAVRLPKIEIFPQLLEKNFDIVRVSTEHILERPVSRIELKPKQKGRSHWIFWIDQTWNTPLAFEERRFDGQLLRRASYTVLDNQLLPKNRHLVWKAQPLLNQTINRAIVGFVPPNGFEAVDIKQLYRGKLSTLEIIYSDGINSFPLILTDQNTRGEGIATRRVGSIWVWIVGSLTQRQLDNSLSGIQEPIELDTLQKFAEQFSSKP